MAKAADVLPAECEELVDIAVESLRFAYRSKRTVFNDVSFTLDASPLVLLGPNGAGKSTLLAILVGLLRPQGGAVRVGEARKLRDLRHKSGWLPQDVEVVPGLNLREQVAYIAWLKGAKQSSAWTASLDALAEVGLADDWKRSAARLSGGQRRRLGIAQAIVHKPSLLVLDEPYAGLDPEQRANVRDTLLHVAGSTDLIVSTHQTEDIESVYRSVLVLDSSQPIWQGSTGDFFNHAALDLPSSARAEVAYREIMSAWRERRLL